jgi:hypothetical protein
MSLPDALCALAAFFIFAMAWLRTRVLYKRRGTGGGALTPAGASYFAGLAVLLALGWFVAPLLAQRALPLAALSAALVRSVWFLAVYYLAIAVHRALLARNRPVFG